MNRFTPILALSLVLTTGTLLAQNGGGVPGVGPTASPSPTSTAQAVSNTLNDINKDLVLNYIHHLNNVEMQQAQLALSQAESDQLRQFAQTLFDEHQQNDNDLEQLATSENVFLQGFQASTYDTAFLNRLSSVPFGEFDRVFTQLSAQEHRAAIDDLQRMSGLVQDPEVAAYVAKKIAELQRHQQQATAFGSGAQQPSPTPTPSGTQLPGQLPDAGSPEEGAE